jgi:hypothetical protein
MVRQSFVGQQPLVEKAHQSSFEDFGSQCNLLVGSKKQVRHSLSQKTTVIEKPRNIRAEALLITEN